MIGPVRVLSSAFFSTENGMPTFSLLVGRARRFTSLVTQLHMEVCGALDLGGETPAAAVFATYHGEIDTAEKLIADLRDNAVVSAARFAQSVHNTPSGAYSIATGRTHATTTMTGENAIAAGWLEAALLALETGKSVLLSIADEPVPAVMHGPPQTVGVAAAFLLAPAGAAGRSVQLVTTAVDAAAPVDPVTTLGRAARGESGAVGYLRPTTSLELRFS